MRQVILHAGRAGRVTRGPGVARQTQRVVAARTPTVCKVGGGGSGECRQSHRLTYPREGVRHCVEIIANGMQWFVNGIM